MITHGKKRFIKPCEVLNSKINVYENKYKLKVYKNKYFNLNTGLICHFIINSEIISRKREFLSHAF